MNKNIALILGAAVIGIASVPIAAMVNLVFGLALMGVTIYMISHVDQAEPQTEG